MYQVSSTSLIMGMVPDEERGAASGISATFLEDAKCNKHLPWLCAAEVRPS